MENAFLSPPCWPQLQQCSHSCGDAPKSITPGTEHRQPASSAGHSCLRTCLQAGPSALAEGEPVRPTQREIAGAGGEGVRLGCSLLCLPVFYCKNFSLKLIISPTQIPLASSQSAQCLWFGLGQESEVRHWLSQLGTSGSGLAQILGLGSGCACLHPLGPPSMPELQPFLPSFLPEHLRGGRPQHRAASQHQGC